MGQKITKIPAWVVALHAIIEWRGVELPIKSEHQYRFFQFVSIVATHRFA